MEKKYSRKILLVNPSFQFSFMKHSALMTLVVLTTFYLFKVYIFWEFKSIAIGTGIPEDHDLITLLSDRSYVVDMSFIIIAANIVLFMLGWALWVSHRVAGPIHRIRNEIKKIIDGQPLQRIGVRDHDYFHELKDSVNLLIEYFRR
ncbi:MAG: hypothetical protein CME71_05415 [Halobacteriovorax sp.]|nr:hypothetical protein [Halobacteriovorax sp.]